LEKKRKRRSVAGVESSGAGGVAEKAAAGG